MTRPTRVVLARESDELAAATLAAAGGVGSAGRITVVIVAHSGRRTRAGTDEGIVTWRIPGSDDEPDAAADVGASSRRRRAARERARGQDEQWGRGLDQARRELARRTGGRTELFVRPLLRLRDAVGTDRLGARPDLELLVGPVIDAEAPNDIVVVSPDLLPLARSAARRGEAEGRKVAVTLEEGPLAPAPSSRVAAEQRGMARPGTVRPGMVRPVVLGVGPTNTAGQGAAWAAALRRADPSARTEVIGIDDGRYPYPSDLPVTRADFDHDPSWGLSTREHALRTWTHALIESGRPPFGLAAGASTLETVELLRAAGVATALVFHGSDIRDPDEHARSHDHSPFPGLAAGYLTALRATVRRNRLLAADAGVPVLVSTPDQLEYVPGATWLPVVIDLAAWPLRPGLAGHEERAPLVVHAPTNPALKGTAWVEQAVAPLVTSGRIRYRSVTGVPPQTAGEIVRQADVVIDQLTLGLYGVLACEALASGAVVIGQVGDRLRSAVPAPVPILEATPTSLRVILEDVLADLAAHRAQAPQRRAFVERFHSGWYSAQTLLEVLSPGSERQVGRDGVGPDTAPTTPKEDFS